MPKATIARDATTIFWQEHGDSALTGRDPKRMSIRAPSARMRPFRQLERFSIESIHSARITPNPTRPHRGGGGKMGVLSAADDGVEKRCMGGIHRVLHGLQPVAWIEIFRARHEPIAWSDKAVIHWERRPPVGRPHIGKDDAAVLMGRIRAVIQPVFQGAIGRLARLSRGWPRPPRTASHGNSIVSPWRRQARTPGTRRGADSAVPTNRQCRSGRETPPVPRRGS